MCVWLIECCACFWSIDNFGFLFNNEFYFSCLSCCSWIKSWFVLWIEKLFVFDWLFVLFTSDWLKKIPSHPTHPALGSPQNRMKWEFVCFWLVHGLSVSAGLKVCLFPKIWEFVYSFGFLSDRVLCWFLIVWLFFLICKIESLFLMKEAFVYFWLRISFSAMQKEVFVSEGFMSCSFMHGVCDFCS